MAKKRSGSKPKSVSATKHGKAKAKQGLKDLQVRDAKGVRGGRKAGEKPLEYMKVTMSDVIITG